MGGGGGWAFPPAPKLQWGEVWALSEGLSAFGVVSAGGDFSSLAADPTPHAPIVPIHVLINSIIFDLVYQGAKTPNLSVH